MIDPAIEEAAERMYLYMRSIEVRIKELELTIKSCHLMLDTLCGGKVAEKEAQTASMLKLMSTIKTRPPEPKEEEEVCIS